MHEKLNSQRLQCCLLIEKQRIELSCSFDFKWDYYSIGVNSRELPSLPRMRMTYSSQNIDIFQTPYTNGLYLQWASTNKLNLNTVLNVRAKTGWFFCLFRHVFKASKRVFGVAGIFNTCSFDGGPIGVATGVNTQASIRGLTGMVGTGKQEKAEVRKW